MEGPQWSCILPDRDGDTRHAFQEMSARLLASAAGLVGALLVAELLLRLSGLGPWTYFEFDLREPTMHVDDPQLGWRNKPGRYTIPPYSPEGEEIRMTFLEDGTRASGGSPGHGPARRSAADGAGTESRRLVLLGGSYIEGFAISDPETLAWRLHERFPGFDVRNYGTAGYGTYQSLLLLERILETWRPALVIYGFNTVHEFRNVAPSWWLKALSRFSRRATVYLPFATADERGELVRHPPERFPVWPLSERLASVNFLQELVTKFRTRDRVSQARFVTKKLILEMRDLARERETPFLVMILGARPAARNYAELFEARRIRWLDCSVPLDRGLIVTGEGHPNGRANTLWADCLSRFLDGAGRDLLAFEKGGDPSGARKSFPTP